MAAPVHAARSPLMATLGEPTAAMAAAEEAARRGVRGEDVESDDREREEPEREGMLDASPAAVSVGTSYADGAPSKVPPAALLATGRGGSGERKPLATSAAASWIAAGPTWTCGD